MIMFLNTEMMSKKNSKKTSKANSPKIKHENKFQLMSMRDKMFNTFDQRNSLLSRNEYNLKHKYVSYKQSVKFIKVSSSLESTHKLIEKERKAALEKL